MRNWAHSCLTTSVAFARTVVSGQREQQAATVDFVVASEDQPVMPVSGRGYLAALRPKAADAIRNTLARVPEVQAVLWSTVKGSIRIVSILTDRSDEVILRVAQRELQLMDELKRFAFEFRTADAGRLGAFLSAGYVPILQKRDYDNSARSHGAGERQPPAPW